MLSYHHYGTPTAPHRPARAQSSRLAANKQIHNYRDPPPHSTPPPRPSYIIPYQDTAHIRNVAGALDQVDVLPRLAVQRQQAYGQDPDPARDSRFGLPHNFAIDQTEQQGSVPYIIPPPSPTWDLASSRSSSLSPPPSPVDGNNPMLHSWLPWETSWRASIPPRFAADGSLVSYIGELPPEILSQIFLQTLPIHLYDARPHTGAKPLIISHVCRLWRDIAIDLPSLWTTLCLTGCPNKHEHRRLKLAKVFMDRARGTGMHICYQDTETEDAIPYEWDTVTHNRGFEVAHALERCYCALDLLISRISEVRVLQLYIGHASSARIASTPAGAAVMLRDLKILFLEGGEQAQTISRLFTFLTGLRRFSWGSYLDACVTPVPVGVPWEHLVSARVETPVPHDAFLDLVASGQQLKDIFIRLCRGRWPLKRLSSCIRQTTLDKLIIYGDEPLDNIFDALYLPALRWLSLLTNSDKTHSWPFARARCFQTFLLGISPGLDYFALEADDCVSETVLISILSMPQMWTLKDLNIDIPLIGDTFFSRLHPELNTPLVPHLKELRVANCVTADGQVASMITSRLRHGYPLQYFLVAFESHQVGRHREDCRALQHARNIHTEVCYNAGVDGMDA
ncbi:uncharacterized protein SCHCODRAFT_02569175 [Schizophyllum commune H4-8]|uniref:uncharacterized protein n=1 Tax=Schizophyllum commune (strain H4-8 / FGSC 9210) TaxID=578458 RepID=UPI00215DF411|nr:uncharacterized protein SCHCODRAFT_02569175 [Schizophyllum commune H4-8]KAI5896526.1 hypothetical protein SCHCODRAFT_02569175 [Schizophyllum commune H4-8]